jgi:hypothetical protein
MYRRFEAGKYRAEHLVCYLTMTGMEAVLLTDKRLVVMQSTTLEKRFKHNLDDIASASTKGNGVLVCACTPHTHTHTHTPSRVRAYTQIDTGIKARTMVLTSCALLYTTSSTLSNVPCTYKFGALPQISIKAPTTSSSKYLTEALGVTTAVRERLLAVGDLEKAEYLVSSIRACLLASQE